MFRRFCILTLTLALVAPALAMSTAGATVRPASPRTDSVPDITSLINAAYRTGEAGILVDSPEAPFLRMTEDDVETMVAGGELLVLTTAAAEGDDAVIGCVRISDGDGDIGEWGCLAVRASRQARGHGRALVVAAEAALRRRGHACARLELLAPTSWKHAHKERLRSWYARMGYGLAVAGDYEGSTARMKEGEVLAGKFVLATDADFTQYSKPL